MRSMSDDPDNCHSCLQSWDSVYNAVLAAEVVWFQWTQEVGIDGSYRIFKAIVTIYEQLKLVQEACHQREIGYTMRNKLVLWEGMFENIEVLEIVFAFFLMWYGIFWKQTEDIGFAIGTFIKQIFGVTLEQFSTSVSDWECPPRDVFNSRETYANWRIGYWD